MMRITHDTTKCIRCGLCASICPSVFELTEEGIKVMHSDDGAVADADAKRMDDVRMAEASCPVQAIHVEEESAT